MPWIVVEQAGRRHPVALEGQLTIGRGSGSQLRIDHPLVSRDHAIIEPTPDGYAIRDLGSRNGTKLNHIKLLDPQLLKVGDHLSIGPATLWVQQDADTPLPDSASLDDDGILFECSCGAKLWSALRLSGTVLRCKRCRGEVQCPAIFEPAERPADAVVAEAATCGVCLTVVEDQDTRHVCGGCGAIYHADCWAENLGCAAYGCKQVNVLSPDFVPVVEQNDETPDLPVEPQRHWDGGLLGASAVASLLGALAFGVLAAGTAVLAGVYLQRRRSGLALAALLVSLVGLAGGVVVSYLYWFKS